VVDDEPIIVEVVSEFLSGIGHEIRAVSSAEAAIETLDDWRPDAVLTDLNLPGASGLDVVRAAKAVDAEVCVVVITGQATTDTAIDALRQGAYDYVQKPFDLVDLQKTIERGIEARRLSQTNRSLMEELKRHERELSRKVQLATWQMKTLFELSSKMSRTLSLEFRLHFICEKAAELTGAAQCLLFLKSEDDDEFVARAGYGMDDELRRGLRFWSGQGLNGMAVDQQTVIRRVGPEILQDAVEGGDPLSALAPQSVLVVPLVTEQRVIGTVTVLDKTGGFNQDDEDFLTLFAGSAAIALDNAILYQRSLELDRLKSEFVAVVSHEIRTPLTVIRGSLELLGDRNIWTLEPRQQQLLDGAQANCDRLMILIRDILDFSKLESNGLPMNFAPASVVDVIHWGIEHLGTLPADNKIKLIERIEPDLPSVIMDGNRIVQVITNLLSNAIKFSPPESAIEVTAGRENGRIVVRVRDRGEGIAAEDIKRLFRKFSQLDSSTTRRVGGTGLGLVISKGIIEAHDGRIWVESNLGEGSTFAFSLPVAGPPTGSGRAAGKGERNLSVESR
jgi:signal transduction histidine kinase/DNA-binding response OmpR family regulator